MKKRIPMILALIGTALVLLSLFLPYAAATDSFAERIERNPDTPMYGEITADDLMNISMVEYTSLYCEFGDEIFRDSGQAILYIVLVALIGVFALLIMLFSFKNKPIVAIILNILTLGIFYIHNLDYNQRGVIPSNSYDWGIGYYLLYIAIILTFIGAIWMLISKISEKKRK